MIPKGFKKGIRVLMLVSRKKDTGKNKTIKKLISTNEEMFDDCYFELLGLKQEGERIYSSVNERDTTKGIMNYRRAQLEKDFGSEEVKYSFYFDTKNRFISSLMKSNAKKTNFFLFDIDGLLETDLEQEIIDNEGQVVYKYKTKNGEHWITTPFNYTKISFKGISTDGLFLLSY